MARYSIDSHASDGLMKMTHIVIARDSINYNSDQRWWESLAKSNSPKHGPVTLWCKACPKAAHQSLPLCLGNRTHTQIERIENQGPKNSTSSYNNVAYY